MSAGVDAIGLALGSFSLVVQIVQCLNKTVSYKELRFLTESLQNHDRIFLNSVESLFRSILPAQEIHSLLKNPSGSDWQRAELNNKIIDHFGPEANGLLETANAIYKTLHRLQDKLPVLPEEDDKNVGRLTRMKLVVKAFVKGPGHRSSLESLTCRIAEFRMLTEDSLRLAPARQHPPRRISNLGLVQDGATILHKALQDGLQCDCEDLHPAHMRLEVWSPEELGRTICLKFSFLFADNAEEAREDHWRIAEIEPLDLNNHPPGVSDTASSQSPSSSLPRSRSRVTFQIDNTIVSSPTQINPNGDQDELADLCRGLMGRLSNSNSSHYRQRLGSISDSGGSNYGLFTTIDRKDSKSTKSSASLVDVLSSPTFHSRRGNTTTTITPSAASLSPKDHVGISLTLAWAVLQLSETSWLKGYWTKENILLVMDPPNDPQPYVSHHFVSSRRRSISPPTSTMNPNMGNPYTSWVSNDTLFALAVVLLEMCYHRPIEELASDSERHAHSDTTILTAMRLSKDVGRQMGIHYAQAVNACLHGNFLDFDNKATGQDIGKFARGILTHVIEPLEYVAKSFGHGPPLVPVA